MKADAHVFAFDTPESPRGKDLIAPCSAVVVNARPVFMWDGQAMGTRKLEFGERGVCKTCCKKIDEQWAEHGVRWLWGCVPGNVNVDEGGDA